MTPDSSYGHLLVTIEAAVGLLGVALATGIMFAKASRPSSSVLFVKNPIITTMHGTQTLMFRLGNARGNTIVDAHLNVAVLLDEQSAEGHSLRRLHDLKLHRETSPMFTLTWTVMHDIDETSPRVDARLPDGSRVNAIIKPLSLIGPVITVRKFATRFSVDDLIEFGTATREMFDFLQACVEARLNVFLSGGTGSGKTTTLNVLSSFIPEEERIITIEDAAELQLSQKHVITLEARPANLEGEGEITIRELLRNALHMRPDRIVVGECRAGEALDMIQAMTTGQEGSLSTGHANTPPDMLRRLETMILMTGYELPMRAIREQIASAVDLIVHQSRLKDGSRRVTSITEVQGMEGDVIVMQEVFTFEQTGVTDGQIEGMLRPTGIRPKFTEKFEVMGIHLPPALFGYRN